MVNHPGALMQAFWHSRLLRYCMRNFEKSEFLEGSLDAFHMGKYFFRCKSTSECYAMASHVWLHPQVEVFCGQAIESAT